MAECIRCGECCRQGGTCDIRKWTMRPYNTRSNADFEGVCDQLQYHSDGTTSCKGILMAFDPTVDWHEPTRKWLTTKFVGRGCDRPELQGACTADATGGNDDA
jgi:hypothetical protein